MSKFAALQIGIGSIAISALLTAPPASAQTRKTKSESSAVAIKTVLNSRKTALTLTDRDLQNYKNFKQTLSPLVISKYKSLARKVDSGFVDAVLRPIYGNLILRKINEDKKFSQQATITSAELKLDILKTGEILLYQKVGFSPKRVFNCSDGKRSTNLVCVQGEKEFIRLEAQYKKNPDPKLEKGIRVLKGTYKKNRDLASRLRGWDLQKMSTLKAAYTALAAMPVVRERGSKFIPAALLAYANPADGSGTTSGRTGNGPSNTPGSRPSNIPMPGVRNVPDLRSISPEVNKQWNAKDTKKLEALNQNALLASSGTTQGLLKKDDDLAWEVTNGGARTSYELLNGFTNNHRAKVGDSWTLFCIDYNPWWPGCTRYWFGFELGYGYLYGVRAGFNVTTTARLTNQASRSGNMRVTMNTGNQNAAIFRGSGLRNQDVFNGKELLARLCQQRSCYVKLLGDLPGPDPLSTRFTRWTLPEVDFLRALPTCNSVRRRYGRNLQCSALDLIRNGEYPWPDASSRVNLARWISPTDLFGGTLNYGVAAAWANPYISLNTTGQGYRQHWRKANGRNQRIRSRSSNLSFNFQRANRNITNPIVTGINNEYDFNFSITPGISVGAHVAGYGIGPYMMDIDALAINSPTFTLYRHNRTYNGFWTGVPSAR